MMSVVGWLDRALSSSWSRIPSSDRRQLWRSKTKVRKRGVVGMARPVSRDDCEGLVVKRLVPFETWSLLALDLS
jgi:hypothetical protein